MDKIEPWNGHEYGRMDQEIYQTMGFAGMTTSFRLEVGNLYQYCKVNSLKVNPTLMKILFHLSERYLPKLTLGINHRVYPAGYHVGYVKAG